MPDLQHLSWDDVERESVKLAELVRASGFAPDCIVGIAVGGLVPLALVAKHLGVKHVLAVAANSYTGTAQGELSITHLPAADLRGKNALLVDEVALTGKMLEKVAAAIRESCAPKELRTAVLAVSPAQCARRPDFAAFEDDRWLVFPWEKAEYPEYFA